MEAARDDANVLLPHGNTRNFVSRSSTVRALFLYPDRVSKAPRPTAWLDGLRGVAAAEVLLHHYHLRFLGGGYNQAYGSAPDTYQWWRLPMIRNYYHSAHAMVNVFFVISGFVLTQRALSLIRSKQQDKLFSSLSSAVFRRLVRIFLPVIPITFLGLLMVRCGLKTAGVGYLPIEYRETIFGQILDWWAATEKFLNPFHNYHNQWDLIHPYEHVMWTLPVEYYGSIVCYVTALGVGRVSNTMKRTGIILIIIYLAMKRGNWWSTNFLCGMLLADYSLTQEHAESVKPHDVVSQNYKRYLSQAIWSIIFLWSFYLCGLPDPKPEEYPLPGFDIYLASTPEAFRGYEDGARFWWMLAGIGLTCSISQLSYVRKVCETRFCQYLGKISFMLYLTHTYSYEIVGSPLKAWLEKPDPANPIPVSRWKEYGVYLIFWMIMLPTVALVSAFATKFIDEPSITFAKTMERYFTTDKEEMGTATN